MVCLYPAPGLNDTCESPNGKTYLKEVFRLLKVTETYRLGFSHIPEHLAPLLCKNLSWYFWWHQCLKYVWSLVTKETVAGKIWKKPLEILQRKDFFCNFLCLFSPVFFFFWKTVDTVLRDFICPCLNNSVALICSSFFFCCSS